MPSEKITPFDLERYPLVTPRVKKKDWVKVGAIIAAVCGGLIAGIAVLSIMQFLPTNLLVGPLAQGLTLIAGAAILAPAAYILFDKWKNPPQPS